MKFEDKFLDSIVDEALRDMSLSKKSRKLDEAYVVQTKKFNVKTESLSEKSKKAHQELLDVYVNALNDISARLDTADRDSANQNNSTFRNLKIDQNANEA